MMSRASVAVLLLLASAGVGRAQIPAINYRGVVNAASFMPQGLPGGGIAQGSIFTIFGRNLGPATPVATAGFPLSNSLSGVSIKVFRGANSVDALPLFVSAGQINAVMPSGAPIGMVSVQVSRNNAKSNPAPVRVVANSLGIFSVNNTGLGPGILQNFVAQNQQPVNNLLNPAIPGQTITMWGTGLGPAGGPDNVAAPSGNLPTQVEVFVGGQAASVQYSGRSPCCSGVDQIVFKVPSTAPPGCWVPVYVRTGGAVTSNGVTIAISADGSPCSEPGNAVSPTLVNGGRLGALIAVRSNVREDVGTRAPVDVTTDYAAGFFLQEQAGPFNYNARYSLPPPGTCAISAGAGNLLTSGLLVPGVAPGQRYLDPGYTFTLTGPNGTRNITGTARAFPLHVGSSVPGVVDSTLFLSPGTYTVTGSGGADVGAFQAATTIPPSLTWVNRDQLTTVNRAQPLTLNWSGVPAGYSVFIFGGGFDASSNSSAVFTCVAQSGATSLTIPAAVLASVPPTRMGTGKFVGAIYLAQYQAASPARFSALGIDTGFLLPCGVVGKTVVFQ